jgi:hypothetical protein
MVVNGQSGTDEHESGCVLCGGDRGCGGFNDAFVEVVATFKMVKAEVFGGRVVLADGLDELAGDAGIFVLGGKVGSISGGHTVLALRSQSAGRTSRLSSVAGRSCASVRLLVDGR